MPQMNGPALLTDWIKRMKFKTYVDAAEYLGVDKSILTKLANGTRAAGLTIALRLERKTGIPVEAWESDAADEMVSATASERAKSRKDKESTRHASR